MIGKNQQSIVARRQKLSSFRRFSIAIDRKASPAYSRGFTILFAVLIGSILLAIGIAIFDITVRELRLSSIARESQLAVYAADSGAECALYWGLPTNDHEFFSTSTPIMFSCNGQDFPGIGGLGLGATSTFQVVYGDGCASVSIATHLISPSLGLVRTIVESRGYNTCDLDSPNRVEREFRVIF